ncbi:DUF58 domain-containing protein [Asticcacaulis sp. AND118]|uniref:DUF58 domain-containing protein n=1 Tax=Asticcacaulis sp. AND118 TaxID=2840468 RepID=UPI001CFF5505|nr:DUF58 domain-containing protein [Asticcacaulis sp. AND118]UDF03943.1 DUF58 domain-containing protein [Asticcacaulis sp. AND118]
MTYDPIPSDVRHRLKGLRLFARRASGASGIGLHASRSRGAGLEFAQYRAYEPGDELRQIDWKLYARSDKFFVREAERESPLRLWMVLDLSASMGQGDGAFPEKVGTGFSPGNATPKKAARADWSRLDAARAMAACVGELALRQGDGFGLIALSDRGVAVVDAGVGLKARDRLRLELFKLKAGGGFPSAAQLSPVWGRIRAQDMVVVFSDGFDEGCTELMTRLSAAGREVLMVQTLTAEERDFPFQGGYRFDDPEGGAEVLGDGKALRADFLKRFAAARQTFEARLFAAGVRHTHYWLDEPVDAPLWRLFGPKTSGKET